MKVNGFACDVCEKFAHEVADWFVVSRGNGKRSEVQVLLDSLSRQVVTTDGQHGYGRAARGRTIRVCVQVQGV